MTDERQQRTVFGEVAEQYDAYRPHYPEALFDAVIDFADARPGDRALEVGAGTGIATRAMTARGLAVTALEPSPGMATVLRDSDATVHETTFEDWSVERNAFTLVYAAQSWHWVARVETGYDRAADALAAHGAIALLWNLPTEWDGPLGDEVEAVYRRYAPHLVRNSEKWDLDATVRELEGSQRFTDIAKRTFPWTATYTTATYRSLLGTHSDHRMLDDDTRTALHRAVGDVIDRHGGHVEVEYTATVYLARRISFPAGSKG